LLAPHRLLSIWSLPEVVGVVVIAVVAVLVVFRLLRPLLLQRVLQLQ
jgi:hypothetical protein